MDSLNAFNGYKYSIVSTLNNTFLNIDSAIKLIHKENVFNIMDEIRKKSRDNYKNKIKDEVIGRSVTTLYNGRLYRIDDIDFNKSPETVMEGNQTYLHYYKSKY